MCIKSAPPMGPPGCPEFAFSTMATHNALILSADCWSILLFMFISYNKLRLKTVASTKLIPVL